METGYTQDPVPAAAGLRANLLAVKVIRACQKINSVLPMPAQVSKQGHCLASADGLGIVPETDKVEVIALSDSQETQASQLAGLQDRQADPETKRRRRRRDSGGSETGASSPGPSVPTLSAPGLSSDDAAAAKPSSQVGQPCRPLPRGPTPPVQRSDGEDIFSAPLHSEVVEAQRRRLLRQDVEPAAVLTVRSEAHAPEGDTDVMRDDVPNASRRRERWTELEEKRLVDGVKRYGKQWALIRTSCSLRGRTTVQLKDKWRNLQKAGAV